VRLADFDFALPDALIALRPAEPRESARLLCVAADGALDDRTVGDLPGLLRAGDVLVVNDSWVTPAALTGERPARSEGGQAVAVAINLLERLSPSSWTAMARPGKRLREGDRLDFSAGLSATVTAKHDAILTLAFDRSGADLSETIARIGAAPLPPYILSKREADAQDLEDYQTVYAAPESLHHSVAAPTAGLHLTPNLLRRLEHGGVRLAPITLGVGAGTFLPVKTDEVDQHEMHAEAFSVGEQAAQIINAARGQGGRIIAVGTTSLRALESCSWEGGLLQPASGATRLFIKPGHRFRSVDGLMTNFHLPRSTLFMLVCAFAGVASMRAAYAHAVAQTYRFFSYGDASLLWRQGSHG